MKKYSIINPTYLLWMALVVILALLGGCQKEEKNEDDLQCPVTVKEGADDDVIGKWKLVKATIIKLAYGISTEDYSCSDIVYHFSEDGSLIISGVDDGMSVIGNGEYSFEFKDTKLYEHMEYDYTLEIGQLNIACGIHDNAMILDASPVDGNILYFIRVE